MYVGAVSIHQRIEPTTCISFAKKVDFATVVRVVVYDL